MGARNSLLSRRAALVAQCMYACLCVCVFLLPPHLALLFYHLTDSQRKQITRRGDTNKVRHRGRNTELSRSLSLSLCIALSLSISLSPAVLLLVLQNKPFIKRKKEKKKGSLGRRLKERRARCRSVRNPLCTPLTRQAERDQPSEREDLKPLLIGP